MASRDSAIAVAAGFLGWTLDAFDYFLVVLCLRDIGKTFAVDDRQMALAMSLTLFMRPVGAFIFGLLSDRYGRKRPLMINVVFYSAMSVLSGMAPSFGLFLICRLLFGIGMGGEWGAGASLAMEKVPPRLRGVMSGLLQEGYMVGNLLASAAYFFLFPRFGWRPLFFLGGLPALLALFIRSHLSESEVWEQSRSSDWRSLGSAILSNWKIFLTILTIMFMMNLTSHGTQDLYPTLLKVHLHYSPRQAAAMNAVASIGAIVGGVIIGMLSDRIGRRAAIAGSFVLAACVIPLWAYGPTTLLLACGAFLIQFFVQGAWGVIPAHITELSPDKLRGFLPGFGYQCAVAIAGSISLLQSVLKKHMSFVDAMSSTALITFVVAAIIIPMFREKRGIVFGAATQC